jgi:hypothetical protein
MRRPMCTTMMGLLLSTFLSAACDAKPVVVLGRALTNSAHDAGMKAAAGHASGVSSFEEHECTEYEPVCGDNNVTYNNRCQAVDAGVIVMRAGAC